ncbi:MAG TPA: GNAT family N-acetyltransferase [Armatimonadota bacterium]|nr:GNAT family N-acetyltransferase [Armatimonadota bacterium]
MQQRDEQAPPKAQLRMIWPERLLGTPPVVSLPDGYLLRNYTADDEEHYLDLIEKAGFGRWSQNRITENLQKIIPGGFFVIEHQSSGKLVATALANHRPLADIPFGGELGWVAADPQHAGKGLGRAVCAAAVNRLLQAGYRHLYLLTDDFRLPAIKIYLRLGFRPDCYCDGMQERWDALFTALSWGKD